MSMKRLVMIIAIAALPLSSAASAETAWEVFAGFSGAGTWALSCKDAPSPQNPWMTYTKGPNGTAIRKMNRGPDDRSQLIVSIDSAHMITATTMEAKFRNADPDWGDRNGVVADIVMIKESGRMRTLESKGSDGKEYIKHGIVVASGGEMPWIEKCDTK